MIFYHPISIFLALVKPYSKREGVCSGEDHFSSTTPTSPIECARFCIQNRPQTRFVEFHNHNNRNQCECDIGDVCHVVPKSHWNVYLIVGRTSYVSDVRSHATSICKCSVVTKSPRNKKICNFGDPEYLKLFNKYRKHGRIAKF